MVANIEILNDGEMRRRLSVDLKDAESVICVCLHLNPFVLQLFKGYAELARSVTVIANHPSRSLGDAEKQIALRRELIEHGIQVNWFRSARLLHQKTILLGPDIVFIGSHNLSRKAWYSNHETTVRIKNQALYDTVRNRLSAFCGI